MYTSKFKRLKTTKSLYMRYHFKQLIIIFFLSAFAGSLFAERPVVVVTNSILADMTQQIGGDAIEVKSIVPIGGDPHLYEPKPRDVNMVNKADLVLMNGLTLEGWIKEMITNSGTKGKVVTVTEGISPIASAAYADSPDPHAWMDPQRGMMYGQNIQKALIDLVPEEKALFEANFNAYVTSMQELDTYIREAWNRVPQDKRILITSHDAFQYYGRRYEVKLESILGISTEEEAEASDLMRLEKAIQSSGVPAIFVESTINPKMMEQIAKDNDVIIGGSLFSDSLDEPGKPAGTYQGMLKANTDLITNGLTRKSNGERESTSAGSSDESRNKNGMSPKTWILIGLVALLIIGASLFMAKKVQS